MKYVAFPWHRCVPGTSFFVPSLDPQHTQLEGLRQGYRKLGRKEKIYAQIGTYKGMLGVLFTLKARKGVPKQRV